MPVDLSTVIISATSTIVGTGGLWTWMQLRGRMGYLQRKDELARALETIKTMKDEHKACQELIEAMEKRMRVIEHSRDSFLARWMKDDKGRLTWMNDKAFLTLFAPLQLSRHQLEGKTFSELGFDSNAVMNVELLDAAARAHHGYAASSLIQMHPLLPPMNIIKIAWVGGDGDLVYEGYAYHIMDPEIRSGIGTRRAVAQIASSFQNIVPGIVEQAASNDTPHEDPTQP